MYNVVNITTPIPAEMLKELMRLSEDERMPIEQLVQFAIRELLNKMNPEKAAIDKMKEVTSIKNLERMQTDTSFIQSPNTKP